MSLHPSRKYTIPSHPIRLTSILQIALSHLWQRSTSDQLLVDEDTVFPFHIGIETCEFLYLTQAPSSSTQNSLSRWPPPRLAMALPKSSGSNSNIEMS